MRTVVEYQAHRWWVTGIETAGALWVGGSSDRGPKVKVLEETGACVVYGAVKGKDKKLY